VKQKTHNIYNKIYKMTHEQLRMQMLSGIITEGEYKAIINKEIEEEEKASLNESMIGGIVGVGAINQIPSRAKTDYEMAFEHFLGEKYELKPNKGRDDIKDINEEMGENIADFLNQNMDEVKEKLGDVYSEFENMGDPKVATAGEGEEGIDVSFDKEHMLELFPEEDPYNEVESIDIAGKTVYYNDYR
jgi:hypothetical protein